MVRSGHDGRLRQHRQQLHGPVDDERLARAAHTAAQRWLDRNEPDVQVETGGDAFPGYCTLETLKGGRITGMISVNERKGDMPNCPRASRPTLAIGAGRR